MSLVGQARPPRPDRDGLLARQMDHQIPDAAAAAARMIAVCQEPTDENALQSIDPPFKRALKATSSSCASLMWASQWLCHGRPHVVNYTGKCWRTCVYSNNRVH